MNTLPRIAVFGYAATIALGVLAGPATANPEGFMATAPEAEASAAGSDYQAGQAAVEGGDYRGAIEHLMKAVAAEPDSADAYNLLGYTHRKLQNFPAAFASYEMALEIDPDHARAHQYIGEA
ncbi:MAG: tetratricopeptide repeat protein, partial [Alphaproteobacteria bacterium]|nr:tetratricopeptide repeat protein [Alphaproteobacteria bacterium]